MGNRFLRVENPARALGRKLKLRRTDEAACRGGAGILPAGVEVQARASSRRDPSTTLRKKPSVLECIGSMDWNFREIESLPRSCKMRNRLVGLQLAEKLKMLSFRSRRTFSVNRGTPRAGQTFFSWVSSTEKFLSSFGSPRTFSVNGMTTKDIFSAACLAVVIVAGLVFSPVLSAQTAARPEATKSNQTKTAVHAPNFSGIWAPRPAGIRINTWDSSRPYCLKSGL